MTYPPAGNDPYGQQPPPSDPYGTPAPPVSADPYGTPVPPVSADPYAAPNPYAQPYPQQPGYAAPAPYGTPYGYPAAPVSAKTNGMAIAALVLGICGTLFACCYGFGGLLGLIGAILGHVGMKQIKDRGEQGRGLALTGVITGWSGVALAIAFWIVIIIAIANDPNFWNEINSGSSSWD